MQICMLAYTIYHTDPRVRRQAEALRDNGDELDIICLHSSKHTHEKGINLWRIPIGRSRSGLLKYLFEYGIFFVMSLAVLSYLTLRRRFTYIHVHNMPNFLVFAALIPRSLGIPIILDIHDPMPEIFRSEFQRTAPRSIVSLLYWEERLSCRFANYLLTIHEPMRRRLQQTVNPHCNIEIIMNLPDLQIFDFDSVSECHAHPADANGFELIYAGTISERHSLDTAIEGIRILCEEMPDLRLRIVGDGPHLDELMKMVEVYGVQSQVIFMEPKPLDQIPTLLAMADVGISTHRQDEFTDLMFSTKVMEYISMNLPVICSRTATMAEYFDEDDLFFFEPRDIHGFAETVRLLRGNDELVRRKLANAKYRLNELSWEKEKRKFLTFVNTQCRY